MNEHHAPGFDPEDPYLADRARLSRVAEVLRKDLDASNVERGDLEEIAKHWVTYAPNDLLNTVVVERACREIKRREDEKKKADDAE